MARLAAHSRGDRGAKVGDRRQESPDATSPITRVDGEGAGLCEGRQARKAVGPIPDIPERGVRAITRPSTCWRVSGATSCGCRGMVRRSRARGDERCTVPITQDNQRSNVPCTIFNESYHRIGSRWLRSMVCIIAMSMCGMISRHAYSGSNAPNVAGFHQLCRDRHD